MKTNLETYNQFREVPVEAQKTIGAGRLKGFTDINPMWRIKMLTEKYGECGFGWYTEILSKQVEEGSDGQKVAIVDINLFVKNGDVWSKGIFGTGGSMLVTNESKGAYTSDECFKMAYTDALSIACKSLGMGADIYFAKDRTKYDLEVKLDTILEQIDKCTTTDELTKLWTSNVPLQANKEFKDAVSEKGNQLKTKK